MTGSTGFRDIFGGQNFYQFCAHTGPASTVSGQAGDICLSNPPTAGFPHYYIYVNSTIGWQPGPLVTNTATPTTITAAAAISPGVSFVNFSPGGYGSVTLASAALSNNGFKFSGYASAAVTLTPLSGQTIYGNGTIAAGTTGMFLAEASNWYRIS